MACCLIENPSEEVSQETLSQLFMKAMMHKNANNAFRMWVKLVHKAWPCVLSQYYWPGIVEAVKENVDKLVIDSYGVRIFLEVGIPGTFRVSLKALKSLQQ